MSTPSLTNPTDFLNALPKPKTDEEYKAVADMLLREMQRMNEHMAANRVKIDRINAENKVLEAETHALLVKLGAPV